VKKTQRNISRKYNFLFRLFYYIILISIVGLFINCNNNKIIKNEYPIIKGRIIVIGNEPFTKFAIIDKSKKVYILKYDKKFKNKLLENQGMFVKLSYKNSEIISKDTILVVVNIEIIENIKESNIYE